MGKNTIDDVFKNLQGQFDIETPNTNHEKRFLEKLQSSKVTETNSDKKSFRFWKPLLAVAASLVLIVTLVVGSNSQEETYDLASVSPEMADTQDYFTTVITEELTKLENVSTEENKTIVNDAIKRINLLEKEYNALKQDLQVSGNDKRVIYAMISNFQNRIDILQTVLLQIENVKQLKQQI